jgi:hypothetical protein
MAELFCVRKPVDIAWDSILARFETGGNADLLASAFKTEDHIESRNFSIIHKTILGLLQLELP